MPSRRSSVKSSSTVKRYAKGKHNVCGCQGPFSRLNRSGSRVIQTYLSEDCALGYCYPSRQRIQQARHGLCEMLASISEEVQNQVPYAETGRLGKRRIDEPRQDSQDSIQSRSSASILPVSMMIGVSTVVGWDRTRSGSIILLTKRKTEVRIS